MFSEEQWEGVSSRLKNMMTSDQLIYSDKYEKQFKGKNITNFIIISNVEAIKHSNGRRYFICDLSTEKQGNHIYFANIKNKCFNDKVGECFYSFLINDVDTANYNAQACMPETKAKRDAIVDLMDYCHKFIKERFYLQKLSIYLSPGDLYDMYCVYIKKFDKKPVGKNKFIQKLAEVGINYKKTNGNHIYDIPYNVICEIVKKYKWNHELDEFIDPKI